MRFTPVINFKNPASDVLSGVIVALVSIPISMGYAQIAGLPAVYGLYGSLLPILLFGLGMIREEDLKDMPKGRAIAGVAERLHLLR